TSSTGRPSNPPFALTSSRQILSAVLITLLGAAPAPVSARLIPTLMGLPLCADAPEREKNTMMNAATSACTAVPHIFAIVGALLCLAVKPGHLSPDIAQTVQCGLPEGSLFRHFFRNIGKGSLAVPMPLLNGAGWWFDSLAPRECLSDHRRDESVAIKRLGSKETGISHLLIMKSSWSAGRSQRSANAKNWPLSAAIIPRGTLFAAALFPRWSCSDLGSGAGVSTKAIVILFLLVSARFHHRAGMQS